jgi:predicted metalloprotease
MKWQGRRTSSNVEDRRGTNVKGFAIGGGLGGGILIIVIILVLTFCGGGDLTPIINSGLASPAEDRDYQATPQEEELAQFVSVVLAETEDVWTEIFAKEGMEYDYPGLVLYTDYVESACGISGAATGPFYCPADQKIYIDLSFYQELQDKFQAPGDFAMAYIIAHEVGHHIQTILGIMNDVTALQSRVSLAEANELSVRLELQADYLAGVWAHHVDRMNLLEEGDIEEALNAASAVGDDRIQKQYQGYVVPDSFTHGTSEQRQRWFYKGFTSGTLEEGDTFNTDDL